MAKEHFKTHKQKGQKQGIEVNPRVKLGKEEYQAWKYLKSKNLNITQAKLQNYLADVKKANAKLKRLEKDPNYYYLGRFTVNNYKSDKMLRQIIVDYRLKPYKYKKNVTKKTLNSGTHTIVCDRMPVTPKITVTASTTITFNGSSYTVGAGTHQLLNIRFTEGNNQITTNGTVTLEYQEGAL